MPEIRRKIRIQISEGLRKNIAKTLIDYVEDEDPALNDVVAFWDQTTECVFRGVASYTSGLLKGLSLEVEDTSEKQRLMTLASQLDRELDNPKACE